MKNGSPLFDSVLSPGIMAHASLLQLSRHWTEKSAVSANSTDEDEDDDDGTAVN